MERSVKHRGGNVGRKFSYISDSVKGMQRERNQDRVYVLNEPGYHLFIIFDGVSSYPESYRYIENYMQFLNEHHHEWLDNEKNGLGQLLYLAYLDCRNSFIAGSTTISALLIPAKNRLPEMVSIGDSRIYAFRKQNVVKLTEDDNISEMPNILTKWVGHDYLSAEDFRAEEIAMDKQFLLCSDGFYGILEKNREAFYCAMNLSNPVMGKDELHRLIDRNNSDDASYILIRIR